MCSILVKISPIFLNVKFGEIDSLGHQTPGILTYRGIKPWLVNTSEVSDPGEIDSPGHQTLASQYLQTLGRLNRQGVIFG